MARNDEEVTASQQDRTIEITINKRSVPITQGKHTGFEVKQAAINAGLQVQLDFVLTEIHGNSPNRPTIGNDDTVNIHPGSNFALIADDDDS